MFDIAKVGDVCGKWMNMTSNGGGLNGLEWTFDLLGRRHFGHFDVLKHVAVRRRRILRQISRWQVWQVHFWDGVVKDEARSSIEHCWVLGD
jgi:hypothetical protein